MGDEAGREKAAPTAQEKRIESIRSALDKLADGILDDEERNLVGTKLLAEEMNWLLHEVDCGYDGLEMRGDLPLCANEKRAAEGNRVCRKHVLVALSMRMAEREEARAEYLKDFQKVAAAEAQRATRDGKVRVVGKNHGNVVKRPDLGDGKLGGR